MQTKPWYTSKTIWGTIFTFVSVITAALGMQLNPDAQTSNAETLGIIGALIGTIFTIIGRVRATTRIDSVGTSSHGGLDSYYDTGDGDGASANDGSFDSQSSRSSNSSGMNGSSLALAIIALPLATLMIGCATPSDEHIETDRKIYEAIAPEVRAWLNGDLQLNDLDADEIKFMQTTLDAWEFHLHGFDDTPVDPFAE